MTLLPRAAKTEFLITQEQRSVYKNTVLLPISEALRINHRCLLRVTIQNGGVFWATTSLTAVLRAITFPTSHC
jgi:hypothetical protein